MSLHNLAHHLQSAGRGEDKVLVHMTPGEVKGLQSLAMSHGGSLTINPQTGLPEAGILSSLLPIVAGAFLGPAGLGLTAMQTGLAVGALGTAATGSLGKGLMMGFGAYGGAGLGEGLMNAGASSLGGAGANAGAQTTAEISKAATDAAAKGQIGQLTGTSAITPTASTLSSSVPAGVSNTGAFTGYQSANLSQGPFMGTTNLTSATPTMPGVTGVNAGSFNPAAYGGTVPVAPVAPPAVMPKPPVGVFSGGANAPINAPIKTPLTIAPTPVTPVPSAAPVSNFDKVGAGIKDVTSSGTKAWEFVKAHPTPFIGVGVGALQSYQEQQAEDAAKAAAAGKKPSYIRPYEMSVAQNQSAYAPSTSTAERQFFEQPRYRELTPYAAKDGGLMSLAVGGPVEEMSAQNAIGDNMMYPQSQLQTPMYANPMVQRPMPNDVISSGIDAPIGRYSGEARFAPGGLTMGAGKSKEPSSEVKYSFDPATQKFTQTTTSTPTTPQDTSFGGLAKAGLGIGAQAINDIFGRFPGWKKIEPQNPTVTTQTSGGIASPYMQQAQPQTQPTNPVTPSINIPQSQSFNQQLGLEAFYPMMEQQLAMQGAQMKAQGYAEGGTANGGYSLGSYSDGGRLLRGPGDGVSDSIPASIGSGQPARLADGEFVVPARIVSEIGNGSTEAGARKLYAMMDRVQKARRKTVGKDRVAVNTKAEKLLPA